MAAALLGAQQRRATKQELICEHNRALETIQAVARAACQAEQRNLRFAAAQLEEQKTNSVIAENQKRNNEKARWVVNKKRAAREREIARIDAKEVLRPLCTCFLH